MNALFNGQAAGEWALSRGLHFGDGVFRTVLIWDEQPVDWRWHMEKLAEDCAALQLQMPDVSILQAEALLLIQGQQRAVLKILVVRKSEGRGYFSTTEESDRLLVLQPAPHYSAENWTLGIKVFKSPIKLARQPALAGVKHLNRLEQVLASRHWPEGMDEAILCNDLDQPICGTRSNLFWVKAGEIYTPPMDGSGVKGVMRSKIIQLKDKYKVAMRIQMGEWGSLQEADEIFVSNALIGIWPVRQLEHRHWSEAGPMSRWLQTQLNHPRLC